MLLYRVVHWILTNGSKVLWRVKVTGIERVPSAGGFVLAPSHRSMMDIPLAAIVTKRRLRFMGKVSVFKIPVLGWLFSTMGGFPVARDGTDRKAVRDSIAMLEAGEALCVFPEGTRQNGPKIQPLQPGAAYLALRSGAPIVPLAIAGSEEILRDHRRPIPHFGRVVIVVGEPIVPEARTSGVVARDRVDALTATLFDNLQHLFDEAYEVRDGFSR
jgi:1-acyl-sn-glycerol-3-phosphate acyltransferase